MIVMMMMMTLPFKFKFKIKLKKKEKKVEKGSTTNSIYERLHPIHVIPDTSASFTQTDEIGRCQLRCISPTFVVVVGRRKPNQELERSVQIRFPT